eukprot:TRINITY_DN46193_c0_g1_i1.p1 TRINITY_DN46193_c0_g1~~TRINITY_DN46193_c0_g1_i1.p1  ORF type:complete len:466 (-),score=56.69 TRINITY_DN46193_c0_g1_i1:95-1438(-)
MAARLKPCVQLVFFVLLQFITYSDRNVMAGLLPIAKTYFDLDGKQSGLLGSGFMGGFICGAPLFAAAAIGATTERMIHIVVLGISIWALAVLLAGISVSYELLLFARILTGIGEAAYCPLAPVIVRECAPEGRKSLFVGIYFASVYVGLAIGFFIPSFFAHWERGQAVFVCESILAIPLILFGAFNAQRFHSRSEGGEATSAIETPQSSTNSGNVDEVPKYVQALSVLKTMRFNYLILGCASCIFTVYGLSFWSPTYMQEVLKASKASSGILLSAETALAGLFATAAGGLILDTLSKGDNSSMYERATRLAFRCSLGCGPCFVAAACMSSVPMFVVCIFLGLVVQFALVAPAQIATLESVPPACQSIAMGLSTLGTHVLGDLISPVLIGYIKDRSGSLVPGMWTLALWICQAPLWFFLAMRAPKSSAIAAVPRQVGALGASLVPVTG